MSKTVVYFPMNNEEGYVSESVPVTELEGYLQCGWFESPANFLIEDISNEPPKPLKLHDMEDARENAPIMQENINEHIVEDISKEILVKKRGRPKKS
ncbi:MAG: hypothetical protein EKK56_00790 [Flavobacteriaceae bacterium]|nr:MAG: hypothetical protein EKK56_00790 [Flavobacteriaceae bacterium]